MSEKSWFHLTNISKVTIIQWLFYKRSYTEDEYENTIVINWNEEEKDRWNQKLNS